MGKNGKENCGKMLNFIEHLNVRGKMRCNREDPDTVYNIIQGGGLRARLHHANIIANGMGLPTLGGDQM